MLASRHQSTALGCDASRHVAFGVRPWPVAHRPNPHAVPHHRQAGLAQWRIARGPLSASCSGASAPATALPATDQAQSQSGLVFGLGAPGSWDDGAVGSPVVRCYVGDDEQRWFMWYSGRRADPQAGAAAGQGAGAGGALDALAPSSGFAGVAVSRDGIHWSRGSDTIAGSRGAEAAADVGSCLAPNGDWWTFDTCHLAPGDVQVLSNSSVSGGVGVYWMFYTGGDFEPVTLPEGVPAGSVAGAAAGGGSGGAVEGLRIRPGLAMSQDGRNWARIEGDHHTGALFDVGKEGEPDALFVRSPQVINVGPRDMRMYYTSWDVSRRRFVVLLATSPDGFKWTKRGVVFDPAAVPAAAAAASDDENDAGAAFDALGAAAVSVARDVDNRQFLMMYEAVATDNRRSIGLAVSKDGTTWRRYGAPVLTAAESGGGDGGAAAAWDGGDVGSPCAVSMSGGRWRLYYGGRPRSGAGPWQGIGLALSVEGGPTFERVPVQFRRRAPKPESGAAAPPAAAPAV